MNLFVPESCLFGCVCNLGLCDEFFDLPHKMITSEDVYDGLCETEKEALKPAMASGRLKITGVSNKFLADARPEGCLSVAEKAAVGYARSVNAKLLCVGNILTSYAGDTAIPIHGIIWIGDQLVLHGLLIPKIAIEKLEHVSRNKIAFRIFDRHAELLNEKIFSLKKFVAAA